MNCKPGELAIGISAAPDKVRNIGAVVRVLREWPGYAGAWEVETLSTSYERGKALPPGSIRKAEDKYMRPLRDSEGADEMLRIAGKPADEFAMHNV